MKKNLFSDDFSFVKDESPSSGVAALGNPAVLKSSVVETTWVDKKTGAEYLIKDQKPTGPQGDFRVSKDLAEERYRTVMGLPSVSYGPRPVENPFEEDRLQPERATQHHEIEESVRSRITFDTRRQLSTQMTNETAPWASETGAVEDHETYTVDHQGRIRDKPANREGPYGRVLDVEDPKRPIFGDKKEAVISPLKPRATQSLPKKANVDLTSLEERLEHRKGLQVLLTSAFRGLFGTQVADHIITRSLADNRPTFDRPVLSRTIMDAGLMKPWEPHAAATGDRRIRPDMTALEIGNRALRTLMKGPLAPEIQDLPKAERDDVALAMGRTILNAVMPSKNSNRPEIEDSLKRDLSKSISLAISPSMVAGLLPSDLLDTVVKPQVQQSRTSNASSNVSEIQERVPISNDRKRADNSLAREPMAQNAQNTILGFSKKRRDLWTVEDREELVSPESRVLVHHNSYSQRT